MREKYYEFTSFILMGIFLVILGVLLLLGKHITYRYMVSLFTLVLWVSSFRDLVKFFSHKLSKRDENRTFLSCVFHILVCMILTVLPDFTIGIAPFMFAIYLLLIGVVQVIMCVLEVRDKETIRFGHVIIFIVCFFIAFPVIMSPVGNLDTFLNCFSLYNILLGISMLWEAFLGVLSVHTKNKLKRRIRITLPKIIEAIIPYSIMTEINRNLALEKKQVYSFDRNYDKVDMDILVHASNRGVNRMGHIDLCFEGMVISFGNYDEGSRSSFNLIGDGVLFMTSRKEDYINFCIDNSKKTVFDFGIILTASQKDAVRKRIQEILKYSVSWKYREDKLYQINKENYASKLYHKTKARFYKFEKGVYRTYFVLGTNCCHLVDDIVGKSGMDILSINGIITPGTYYDYLNRELRLRKSNVVTKEIYNQYRRPKKRKK